MPIGWIVVGSSRIEVALRTSRVGVGEEGGLVVGVESSSSANSGRARNTVGRRRSRQASAASSVRSGAGRAEQPLEGGVDQACPCMAGGDGGSGRRSMAENRKASAQSLNVDTFDGDNREGSSNATP